MIRDLRGIALDLLAPYGAAAHNSETFDSYPRSRFLSAAKGRQANSTSDGPTRIPRPVLPISEGNHRPLSQNRRIANLATSA